MFSMMNLLTQSIALPRSTNSKEPKVKDPETFHENRNKLTAFLTECELIFVLQRSRFADDSVKINYMISLLRDSPLLAVQPLLMRFPWPVQLIDLASFSDYLRVNYGDPDEKGTARRGLKALKQTGLASAYFAEFQQYVAILGWQDQEPIVDRAVDGLKPHLKDELARIGHVPQTLANLIGFIIPLDNRLYEREQEKRKVLKVF
jgi:hypothetical protein